MRLSDESASSDPWLDELDERGEVVEESSDQARNTRQSRLISRVLSPAVQLWVRSQLEQVEDLHLEIEAGDRQLLSGSIHRVSAAASKAVYQDLHFSQIKVTAEQIQTNLPQMLRGKAFRLLTAFPLSGEVALSEADLNASLKAPLLAKAVTEFLLTLLPQEARDEACSERLQPTLQDVRVSLGAGDLMFTAILSTQNGESPIAIRTGIAIKNGNLLKLEGFQHQHAIADLAATSKTSIIIPLGSDVHLETLTILDGFLYCKGRITVIP
ncbi:Protein of unknown function (DUF2993) [Leptolyngbyaceae cyanobacterium JSC-12]|nr:Protein of unknown function (DUF2993) [Leptolyngbyaceae cyanobacterium JSC-12]